MKLLLDSDAFCKLAVGGVLRDAVRLVGADLQDCGRLPALPYMLRKGRFRKWFGPGTCDALAPVAEEMPMIPQPSDVWLDRLTPVQAIDPGEAQLCALAAETNVAIISGDKRALRALKEINGYPKALAGRIMVLEAVLLALCDRLGPDVVRGRVQPLLTSDRVVQVCFSTGNPDPQAALLSYYRDLVAELDPLVLWDPSPGRET